MKPEDHRDFLLSFLHALYRIIEEAIPETQAWFEDRNEPIEPFQFAHTVRYKIKMGIQKLEPSDFKVSMKYLPNNGLEINFERASRKYCIKIYKGVHGMLPAPGHSESKKRFWEQGTLFAEENLAIYNVAIIWNVDFYYSLTDLQLVRPALIGSEQRIGQQLWSLPISHPAEMMTLPESDSTSQDETDLDSYDQREDDDDLDISKDDTGTK